MSLIVVGVFLLGAIWFAWKRAHTFADISVVDSGIRRKDLLFGYYGNVPPQLNETRDHINLFMECQWSGVVKAVQDIQSAKMTTMLCVDAQVFDKGVVKQTAEAELSMLFSMLQAANALQYIKIIYPIDEPNNTTTIGELVKGVDLIKRVAKNYPDLTGLKLAVIYASGKTYIGREMFDYIGVDDYDKKSAILNVLYPELKAGLLPFQKLILVPGGSYGQDPTPFINYAQATQEVGIVMPFVWFDDTNGNVGAKGIRSLPVKAAYIAAGKQICGNV